MMKGIPAMAALLIFATDGAHAIDEAVINKLCRAVPKPSHPRDAVDTAPAVLAVESIMRRGEYFDVVLVYGYGDNYARAEEIGRVLTVGKTFPQRFRVISCFS